MYSHEPRVLIQPRPRRVNHQPPQLPPREATLEQQVLVVQKRALGMSYRAIAAEVGVAKDTERGICCEWERSGKRCSIPRGGWPPKLSERDHRYLRCVVDENPAAPLSEIAMERTSARNRLGMNSEQYTHEISHHGLVTFVHSLPGPFNDYEMIYGGHKAHLSRQAGDFRSSQSITRVNWPSDLNAIENVWAQLKKRIPRRKQQAGYSAHGRKELIAIAQEELELIDW